MLKEVNIDNLKDSSKQEVFNYIANHLLTQGAPAIENGVCKYRTSEGLKCAAGCLIPDKASTDLLHSRWDWVHLVQEGLVPSDHAVLIMKLQKIHDNAQVKPDCVLEDWREKLRLLARERDIEWIFD